MRAVASSPTVGVTPRPPTRMRRPPGSPATRERGSTGVVAKEPSGRIAPANAAGEGQAPAHRRLPWSAGTARQGRQGIGSLLLGLYDTDGALHHVGPHLVVRPSPSDARSSRNSSRWSEVTASARVEPRVARAAGSGPPTAPGRRCVPNSCAKSPSTPAERPLPPRIPFPPLAAGQGSALLRLRTAVAAGRVLPRRHLVTRVDASRVRRPARVQQQ